MSDAMHFTSTKLNYLGKKGDLRPNVDNYYTLIVGGLNTFNSANEYYPENEANNLFLKSSKFMRRVTSGCLYGELGHPKQIPGMSQDDYVRRILTIDESNICCHFKNIWLDTQFGKNNPRFNNPKLIAIMAEVKPSGAKGSVLQDSLANKNENVAFSIRSLTSDYWVRGVKHKVLHTIVCWDVVVEPGIAIANKWDSPSLEKVSEQLVTIPKLKSLCNESRVSLESRSLIEEIKEVVSHKTPIYTN